jgi:hypothetical protein
VRGGIAGDFEEEGQEGIGGSTPSTLFLFRSTLPPMANHDRDAWRLCTLESTAQQRKRLWLGCNGCGRTGYIAVEDFCKASGISPLMPHKLVGMRLRCTRCGSRDCFCWSEPYSGPSGLRAA